MTDSPFHQLPETITERILKFLDVRSLLNCAQTCKLFRNKCRDEDLWKELFYKDWNINRAIALKPDTTYFSEYERLHYYSPVVKSEVLPEHKDQVLHVGFSHDGTMFATSSNDGYVKIWRSQYPAEVCYSANMRQFGRETFPVFSQFNEKDTLLAVSLFGGDSHIHNSSTEIVVLSFGDKMTVESSRKSAHYLFGNWYNNSYVVSGQTILSSDLLCLNYAYQSAHTAVVTKLYKFHNVNVHRIRHFTVANCINVDNVVTQPEAKHVKIEDDNQTDDKPVKLEDVSQPDAKRARIEDISQPGPSNSECKVAVDEIANTDVKARRRFPSEHIETILDPRVKYLIYTETLGAGVPHVVHLKKIMPFNLEGRVVLDWSNLLAEPQDDGEEEEPDSDVSFHFHATVIGIALSPNHRYLCIVCKPWPDDYDVEGRNDNDIPPTTGKIEIHIIDLTTLEEIGPVLSTRDDCIVKEWLIDCFADICEDYVASGAEDHSGYIWDRYYRNCFGQYHHHDLVNSVAFNPVDPEVLITASNDSTIKIWRSRNRMKQIQTLN